jgi:hypothetical protein
LTAINVRKIGKRPEIAAKGIGKRKMKVKRDQREVNIVITLGQICHRPKRNATVSD